MAAVVVSGMVMKGVDDETVARRIRAKERLGEVAEAGGGEAGDGERQKLKCPELEAGGGERELLELLTFGLWGSGAMQVAWRHCCLELQPYGWG